VRGARLEHPRQVRSLDAGVARDVLEHGVERARDLVCVERVNEESPVAHLAVRHEPPELLLVRTVPVRLLLLVRAERAKLSLLGEEPLDGIGAEGPDQLVLEVGVAHVEPEPLHVGSREVGAEAGALERPAEAALFAGVAQPGEPHPPVLERQPGQERPERLRAADRDDGDALRGEVAPAPFRERFQRGAVAQPLDDDDRTFFRRLAVFRGTCTLEAAERVCDPAASGADALELMGSLIDKSLVQRVETDGEPRFRLLFVIREFAKERLGEDDDERSVRRRHAEFMIDLLREAASELFGPDRPARLDELEREHDNVRSAIAWAIDNDESRIALGLVSQCWRFWQMRGHLHEARERIDEVLGLPGVEDLPVERADALEAAGGIAYWMADWPAAEERYEACLRLRREIGDPPSTAEAAFNLACVYAYGPEPFRSVERADELLVEAEGIFRERGDRLGLAKVLWAAGGNVVDVRPADAIEPFRESLALYRETGDRFGEAWALHMLGITEALTDALEDGEGHVRQALELFVAADDRSAVSILLNDFAVLAVLRGDVDRALRLNGAAAATEKRSGVGLGLSATDIGGVLRRMWDTVPRDEAQALFDEGMAMSTDEALDYATKVEG